MHTCEQRRDSYPSNPREPHTRDMSCALCTTKRDSNVMCAGGPCFLWCAEWGRLVVTPVLEEVTWIETLLHALLACVQYCCTLALKKSQLKCGIGRWELGVSHIWRFSPAFTLLLKSLHLQLNAGFSINGQHSRIQNNPMNYSSNTDTFCRRMVFFE